MIQQFVYIDYIIKTHEFTCVIREREKEAM